MTMLEARKIPLREIIDRAIQDNRVSEAVIGLVHELDAANIEIHRLYSVIARMRGVRDVPAIEGGAK